MKTDPARIEKQLTRLATMARRIEDSASTITASSPIRYSIEDISRTASTLTFLIDDARTELDEYTRA